MNVMSPMPDEVQKLIDEVTFKAATLIYQEMVDLCNQVHKAECNVHESLLNLHFCDNRVSLEHTAYWEQLRKDASLLNEANKKLLDVFAAEHGIEFDNSMGDGCYKGTPLKKKFHQGAASPDPALRETQLAVLRIATRIKEIALRAGRETRTQLGNLADNIQRGVVAGDPKRICSPHTAKREGDGQ